MRKYLFLLFIGLVALPDARGQNATVFVVVSELRSASGSLVIQLFADHASFVREEPLRQLTFDKKGLVNGVLALRFEVESGTYGIALLDDENGNGKMDNNVLKMPKEGFGFSNFYLTRLARPHFDDFKVVVRPGKNKVDIRTKYL